MPFNQITKGPSGANGGNQSSPGLVLDTQNNICASVGDSRVEAIHQTSLQILTAQVALTAITTAQNLINKAINGGLLNRIGRTIQISGSLIYTSPGTTAPVITIALVVNGVTLCSIVLGAISTTASANMPIQFQFTFTTVSVGAAGTIESHGWVCANLSANTPAAAATEFMDTNTAVSGAVNMNAAGAIAVTIAANSVVTSAQLRQAMIEVVS
jgi:hypothetical protein